MSFLSGLMGGGKSASTQQTAAVGLQVQTSVQGKPIPLLYGMTRVAPNLIWYGNFTATQQSSSVGGKGGLTGSGGKGGGSGSYVYSASLEMALCEGQIGAIWNVYADKNISTTEALGMAVFSGAYQQAPWSYLLQSQGQIDNETHLVPGTPYHVTTNQSFLYDLSVTVTSSVPFTYYVNALRPTLSAGQYNYSVGYSNVTYNFALADNGKLVTIRYTLRGVPESVTGTITNEQVAISNVLGSYFVDVGVTQTIGSPLAKVSGSPAGGQYSQSGGIYTFNSTQSGANVLISYVPNNGQSQALGYSGIAYVATANYSLGNNPSLPNFNFEVQGTFSGTVPQQVQGEQFTLPATGVLAVTVRFAAEFVSDAGVTDQDGNVYKKVSSSPGTNQYAASAGVYTFGSGNAGSVVNISYNASVGPDADPSLIVPDLLTNVHYGIGFPVSRVGSLSTYQAYCVASGLLISPLYDTQTQASSMLTDIATATNSNYVWSSGTLTLVPYGDQATTANGFTYTPPSSPLYSLTDDDFLPNSNLTSSASASFNDDPVLMTRTRPADAYNSIQLEWLDRGNNYSPAIVQAKDQAAINSFGLRQDGTRSFHMFCNGNAARTSVQLQLQRQSVRNIYQFTLDQRYVLLDPMDIVAITDANLGLNQQWVRITEITENDDSSLSVVAEEYLQGTGTAPAYGYQSAQGFYANYNGDPSDANAPVLFEPTAELAEDLEVWMAVSGGSFWGGCEVWISQDNETYQQVGKITGPSRQGYATAALPPLSTSISGQTIDQTNTLGVDITESGGQLLSASQADAQNLATLCYLGSGNTYELMSYQNATLISQSVYNISYLVRGAYGSSILSHAAGEQFARLDSSIFKYPYTQDRIGTALYVKLLSFNIYGGGQQNLGDVAPYTFNLQGVAYSTPLPDITNLRTTYVASITQLMWDEVTDFRPVLYEVRKGGSWVGAQVLGRVAHPPFNVQGNGTYWVSAFSQPVPGLQVYSEEPVEIVVSGAQIVSNVIASFDEAATGWQGTTGGTAVVSGGIVRTSGTGNILALADYLDVPDIFNYGGEGNGTYQIPVAHQVNIGRVAPCSVIISWSSQAQHITDNILTVSDYLNFQDLLDSTAQTNATVYPEIALSQDGVTWGAWQKYVAGSYPAMAYNARIQLQTNDPTVEVILDDFIFEVDVPDRDDHYVNLSLPAASFDLTFMPDGTTTAAPFNGGPQGSPDAPAVQVTILNAQAGDQVSVTNVTLSGCSLEILNGGSPVTRIVNVLVEGY